MIYWADFAKEIQKKRISMNKSIQDVSKELALNKYKYYRIESGIQEPSFLLLQKILEYYNIELKLIFHK